MKRWLSGIVVLLVVIVLASACAGGAPRPAAAPRTDSTLAPGGQGGKRITAAIRGSPKDGMAQQRAAGLLGRVPGLDALEQLVAAGLDVSTDEGRLVPQLAEAVPTVDNGLWQVFPDGRMQTTWKLRPDVVWHDGQPLTPDDLFFSAMIEQDPDLGMTRDVAYDLIESMDAPDARTVVVTWKRPYIQADAMFSYEVALPLPKHLLEDSYNQDKTNFLGIPYWSTDYVGAGPYRVQDWVADSHVVLAANDHYALGRPKIDEIEVRFIPDPNTLMANVLAGVEMSLGRALSLDQALRVGEQWPDGRVATRTYGWVPANPQLLDPTPAIIANYQFRQAMLEAIDRQQLVDSLMAGKTSIAGSIIPPDAPEYRDIESSIVRYPYDPRQAAQLMEGLGYTKGADGIYHDGSGQPLAVEIKFPVQNDIHGKMTAAVADFWQQFGVSVEQTPIPIQRMTDREYVATFPGFELIEVGLDATVKNVMRFHSSSTPLPENHFTATGNYSRYRNQELDDALDTYITSIPMAPRIQALGAVVHHMSQNLTTLPLIHTVTPSVVSNRIQNVTGKGPRSTEAWNAQDWDVK